MTAESKSPKKLLESLPYFVGIVISFLVALHIRTLPKAGVFLSNGFVRFGGNDPWYHLRNVESILHHFPNMLWFDAYTHYPFGTNQVFAPLFDMFLASVIWVLGGGNPDQDLIYNVSAYYPAFLGALVLVPTYYAAKWVFDDRRVGLLSVFILAVLPGQFLSRSMIGFNDHHIAETLLSTVTAMFFIMALNKAGKYEISFEKIKNKDFDSLKGILPYLLLTGIFLGAYALAWKGALFFAFILGAYITVQHVLDHMKGKPTDYVAISGMFIFAVAFFIVMLTPHLGGTKSLHMKGLLAGIFAFPILTGISVFMNNRKLPKYYYPFTLGVLFVAGIGLAKIISPSIFALIMSVFSYFLRTGGALTIAEASPFFSRGGLEQLYVQFAYAGYVVFLGLALLVYEIYKRNGQEKSFLLVWTLMIFWAMLQQNRFAYYFSVNVAILSAYFAIWIADSVGLKSLSEDFKAKVKSVAEIPDFVRKNLSAKKAFSIVVLLVSALVLIVPSYGAAMEYTKGTGGPNGPWIEATLWLNSNTPDPGLDFYENYEIPADGELYSYPDSAYGVMSWWDYGHWIEVIGRRIPNANPFQQGVGGRRNSLEEQNKPGASTFFTAQSEEEATAVLEAIHPDPDKVAARYVVSDVEMATGKFYAMTAWTLDSEGYYESTFTGNGYQTLPALRYYNSMEARLHLFDGTGLEQYRLVHETWAGQTAEMGYKQVFNYLYLTQLAADDPRGKLDEEDTGYVKIFEYVKGAKISGTASSNEKVMINTIIMTGQGRDFEYSQSTTADAEGRYEFTVPYSTEGPISGETQFDTAPIRPYLVSYGSTTKEVGVSEEAVLNGEEIKV